MAGLVRERAAAAVLRSAEAKALLDAVALVNDSRDATEEAGRAARTIVAWNAALACD